MFDAYFLRVGKRPNSTARPDITTGTERLSIHLLEPSSVINPIITLDSPNPTRFNYCYIPTFERYYFINNWTWENGIWQAQLNCDVLATWKDDIGNSTNYVLRSASNYDGSIVDNMFPTCATATFTKDVASEAPFSDLWENTGWFCIGLINKDYVTFGATSYFLLSSTNMGKFMNALLGDISAYNISVDELSLDLQKALVNPTKYITSVVYLPFSAVYNPATVTTSLPCGWWDFPLTDGQAFFVDQTADRWTKDITVTLSKHPQQATRGVYTNAGPYTQRNLVMWPFGVIPLDTSVMADISTLYINVEVDQLTGLGILSVYADSAHTALLLTRQSQVGVPCQIAQITTDLQTMAIGGLTSAIGAGVNSAAGAFGNPFTGAPNQTLTNAASGINAIGNAIQASAAQLEVKGNSGSLVGYGITPYVASTFRSIVDDDNNDLGRPLCQRVKLNTLSGYMLINDPQVVTFATEQETQQILNYMATGFFYD